MKQLSGLLRKEKFLLWLVASWLAFLLLDLILKEYLWIWQWLFVLPTFSYILVSLIIAIAALVTKQKSKVIWLVILTSLCLSLIPVDLNLLISDNSQTSKHFSYLNWNTEFWQWDENRPDFIEAISKYQPDVFVLQEYFHLGNISDLALAKLYTEDTEFYDIFAEYEYVRDRELITFSKYPIVNSYKSVNQGFLRTDLDINGKIISVYNIHILVPTTYLTRPEVLVTHPLAAITEFQEFSRIRQLQFQELIDNLKSNSNEIVMSGDFNSTKWVPQMNYLVSSYQDSYSENHVGYPSTWALGPLHLWRIDYILYSKGLGSSNYQQQYLPQVSDHQLIYADIYIN